MFVETIESEGLAHLSYLLGDEGAGVAAAVDPRRDVDVYLERARSRQVRITHVLETHVHADFVSGSRELAARTGAELCTAGEGYRFTRRALAEGDELEIGELRIRALHTPGHTPEHLSFLVSGGKGAEAPWGLFCGDTLMSGEVGRPDLVEGASEEALARELHRTLFHRLGELDDGLQLFPAHGKGSPCGAKIGDRRSTTLGYERRHNPRLQAEDEEEFVRGLLSSLPPPPRYYARLKEVNAGGPRAVGALPDVPPLDPERFREEAEAPGTVVVDTREVVAFGGGHVEGSLNIALRSLFPVWAGWMLDPGKRVLLVVERAEDVEVVQRYLLRIGIEEVAGYLRRGMRGWTEAGLPFRGTGEMSVGELRERIERGAGALQVLDVRSDAEWGEGRVPGARHVWLPELEDNLDLLDREHPVAVYCGSGYRASIAASLLERHDFREVHNVPGSMTAWKAAGYPLEGGEEAEE